MFDIEPRIPIDFLFQNSNELNRKLLIENQTMKSIDFGEPEILADYEPGTKDKPENSEIFIKKRFTG
ncbi:unnamed protein product [Brachionus calyciflorus]|uniref:Uncharacterized protein n=1 Tax=Brachionus calyciflorus TaxID=104777 RepID=A0A814SSE0_9BILA|nr:unnamed protein product [Brachionus calyciflorus]